MLPSTVYYAAGRYALNNIPRLAFVDTLASAHNRGPQFHLRRESKLWSVSSNVWKHLYHYHWDACVRPAGNTMQSTDTTTRPLIKLALAASLSVAFPALKGTHTDTERAEGRTEILHNSCGPYVDYMSGKWRLVFCLPEKGSIERPQAGEKTIVVSQIQAKTPGTERKYPDKQRVAVREASPYTTYMCTAP